MAAELVFEIEYIDRETGDIVTKTVSEMRLAQKLAKELAVAHGRRASITRKAREKTEWSLYFADLETGEVFPSERPLTKSDAMAEWYEWKARRERTVCVPWPSWAPAPTITFQA